jgi:hypothetical protein
MRGNTVSVVHEAETSVNRTRVDFSVEALVKICGGLESDGDFEEAGLGLFFMRREVEDVSLGGGVEAVGAAGSEGDCPCSLTMRRQVYL